MCASTGTGAISQTKGAHKHTYVQSMAAKEHTDLLSAHTVYTHPARHGNLLCVPSHILPWWCLRSVSSLLSCTCKFASKGWVIDGREQWVATLHQGGTIIVHTVLFRVRKLHAEPKFVPLVWHCPQGVDSKVSKGWCVECTMYSSLMYMYASMVWGLVFSDGWSGGYLLHLGPEYPVL